MIEYTFGMRTFQMTLMYQEKPKCVRIERETLFGTQIPFAWLTYHDGDHGFMHQQYKRFADVLNAFMK